MANKPRPEKAYLEQLYLKEGMSAKAIGQKFSVSGNAVLRWLDKYGIPRRSQEDAVRLSFEQSEAKVIPLPQTIIAPFASINTTDANTSEHEVRAIDAVVAISGQAAHISAEDDDQDTSAFARLSGTERRIAMVYAEDRLNQTHLTIEQLCNEAKVSNETWNRVLKDKTVQEATLEIYDAGFRLEGNMLLRDRLLELLRTGKDRPEDRRLFAEIFKLIGQQGTTINVGISLPNDGRLRGIY